MVDKFNFPEGTKRMIRKHALTELLPSGTLLCLLALCRPWRVVAAQAYSTIAHTHSHVNTGCLQAPRLTAQMPQAHQYQRHVCQMGMLSPWSQTSQVRGPHPGSNQAWLDQSVGQLSSSAADHVTPCRDCTTGEQAATCYRQLISRRPWHCLDTWRA